MGIVFAAQMKWMMLGGAGSMCVLLGVGVLALAVLGFVVARVLRALRAAPEPTPERHGMGIVGIITGADDYGSWSPEAPREMLHSSWEIADTDSAVGTIEQLLAGNAAGDALVFDRVRAAHLARACAGAQFLDPDSSWAYVARAGRDLQAYYDSWEDVGAAYRRAKNAWLEARGLDTDDGTDENLAWLRGNLWLSVPFDLPL